MAKVTIIGGGFSGLSAACFAAQAGHDVAVLEKNETIGGRARMYQAQGFKFDMGPSWYWMPDIFENFFQQFGKSTSDYYKLTLLDPGFQLIFSKKDQLEIPATLSALYEKIESIEKGSADKLKKLLQESKFKYDISMKEFIYKPSLSWMEYFQYDILKGLSQTHLFKSMRKYIRTFFKDERLIMLMEFPILFLGGMPNQIPALYSLMNYAAFSLGTWYPMGGMYKIIEGMHTLASSLGVEIHTNCEVKRILIDNKSAKRIYTTNTKFDTDAIIASGDYHHIEQNLFDKKYQVYTEKYWNKRTFAPSCLIYYIGVNKKIKKLLHHNLFFDSDFTKHSEQIYRNPQWPEDPLFYVCCPSKTDPTVAPSEMENLFILIPIATGLEDSESMREHYFSSIIKRIEAWSEDSILPHIIYKKTYCINDFINDYHAYKGNAYGLANTLRQTGFFRPSIRSKKIKNLFYSGQLTVPGPGVPPALISGQIAAEQAIQYFKKYPTKS